VQNGNGNEGEAFRSLVGLCAEEPEYIGILLQIIEQEREGSPIGWNFSSIKGWSGEHSVRLMDMGLIQVVNRQGSHVFFKMVDKPEVIEKILQVQFPDSFDQCKTRFTQLSLEVGSEPEVYSAVIDNETKKRFEEIVAEGKDMVTYWAPFINPKIEGMEELKTALLLSLASVGDQFGDRGRIHVLMKGEPGCAKSELQQWIALKLGAESCSQRTSKVGLTGDGRGDEITPGALPRAHGGVLCIDELDKFSHGDRQGLLESMEDGIVQIEVGGKSVRFPAECRIIASANNVSGFSPELLDRFDFTFDLKAPTGDNKKKVVSSIITHWMRNKAGYEGDELKKYLAWIKDFVPEIPDPVRKQADLLVGMYIDFTEDMRQGVRAYENVLRVAYTRAKLNHRDVVLDDIYEGIITLNPGLNAGKKKTMAKLVSELVKEEGTDQD